MTATVLVNVKDHVARISLNRPEVANTLDARMASELRAAALRCETDPDVRAVILSGTGKQFCFGGDLRGMMEQGGNVEAYLNGLTDDLHGAITAFTRMNAPVIAAVNGTAAGAGVGLVAMADLAIAGSSAKFALAYTGVGLTPDGSTSLLLPRAVGRKRAMELFLTNRVLSAQEALDWGLLNRIVADESLEAEALTLATRLAGGPTRAFGGVKRLMASTDSGLETQMAIEGRVIAAQATSAEGAEGIKAFLEKRKPQW